MMIRLPEGKPKRSYKPGEYFATDAITDHALFIHDDWREDKGNDVRVVPDIPQWPIAPIEIRDVVPAICYCLSPRRRGCDTSGSPLPICRTEPAQAVRSISGFVSPIYRATPGW